MGIDHNRLMRQAKWLGVALLTFGVAFIIPSVMSVIPIGGELMAYLLIATGYYLRRFVEDDQ